MVRTLEPRRSDAIIGAPGAGDADGQVQTDSGGASLSFAWREKARSPVPPMPTLHGIGEGATQALGR